MQLLQPGADFAGRYEIVRTISTGGMGVVYEVLHRETQRRRALKVMLPSLLSDRDMRERFAREAVVTAGVESEHLVEIFDAGVEPASGAPFLVMELLRGEDLGARLTRGERTSPEETLAIVDQVARALTRTHQQGIVHRDLKPENLFVTRRDDGSLRMRILDFGIAKLVDPSSKTTRAVGTPLYMAPEQMGGRGIGVATDVYAMGQIAYTLLVGVPYFEAEASSGRGVLAFMTAVATGVVEPASERAADAGIALPDGFDGWFARATAVDPDARFRSIEELASALHAVLDHAPEHLPPSVVRRRVIALQRTQAPPEPVAPRAVPALSTPPGPTSAIALPGAPSSALTPAGGPSDALTPPGGGATATRTTSSRKGTRSIALALAAAAVTSSLVIGTWMALRGGEARDRGVTPAIGATETGPAVSADRAVEPDAPTARALPAGPPAVVVEAGADAPPMRSDSAPGAGSSPPRPGPLRPPAGVSSAASPAPGTSAAPVAPASPPPTTPPAPPTPSSEPAAPSTSAPPVSTVWSGPRR